MTIIAWDGTTLAADKRACTGGSHFTVTKIWRDGPDRLVGGTGAWARSGAFRQWLAGGAKPADYPENPKDDDLYLMIVHRDGRIQKYENTPWPVTIEEPYYAIGSGRDYARAAMHLGQSARGAVEVACLFDEACGNGIDTLTFEDTLETGQ